jgi:hypothetical protein
MLDCAIDPTRSPMKTHAPSWHILAPACSRRRRSSRDSVAPLDLSHVARIRAEARRATSSSPPGGTRWCGDEGRRPVSAVRILMVLRRLPAGARIDGDTPIVDVG